MAAAEESLPDMYLNFYDVQKSNLVYVSDSISPSPSAQSEGSVDLTKEKQHYVEFSSNSDNDDSAQELTNLTWLTQLKNLVEWPNSINPIIDDDKDSPAGSNGSTTSSLIKKDSLIDRFHKFVEQARQHREAYNQSADMYQLDTKDKPPFNYAQMIAMAMLENGRMTLQNIYTWIQSKFGYYRVRNNWNNSIRHNLSLQFCFRKIDRNIYNKGDGKGGYWELGIDANKSERKRVRNRTAIRASQKLPTDGIDQKRKKIQSRFSLVKCDNLRNQPVDIKLDNYKDTEVNGGLINRTLNSINTSANMDQLMNSDDLGIGSIIEVNSQVALVTQERALESHQQQNAIDLRHTTNEFHVLSDITQGDYLNISTLDFMSSEDDIFDSRSFETAGCGTGGIASLSICSSNAPTLVATMVDPDGMETQCDNEILLASEVPQPSENVIISELNPYGQVSELRIHSTNFIIEEGATNATSVGSISENDVANLTKSFTFEGVDHEFQLLPNCAQTNRDDMIEVFLNILPNDEF